MVQCESPDYFELAPTHLHKAPWFAATMQRRLQTTAADNFFFPGFVMDRGRLFDKSGVGTLVVRSRHSIHCLVDVGLVGLGPPAGRGWPTRMSNTWLSSCRNLPRIVRKPKLRPRRRPWNWHVQHSREQREYPIDRVTKTGEVHYCLHSQKEDTF